jgi:heme/copper-type cytochrome/quinol oxidase subunit 3
MSTSAAVRVPLERVPRIEPARFGVWLFLVSEAMFFAALIAAFVVLRSGSGTFGGPGGALGVGTGSLATLALLLSSGCAWRARVVVRSEESSASAAKRLSAPGWLLAAIALGALFLLLQGLEYRALFAHGLSPRSNLYWSCFFVLTSVHALHVMGGLVWLFVARASASRGAGSLRVELAVLYWQLVDLVWLVLFALLYL